MASATEKRCLYEVVGLGRDCSMEEIRSAYKKLALQRHPDKLVQSGVPEAEATAQFQELLNAYQVLSDPKERSSYDFHRFQIHFSSDRAVSSGSPFPVPDLFPYFSKTVYSGYSDSGRGFYKVYSDVFSKIYAREVSYVKSFRLDLVKEAPLMGNFESPYSQVTAFYKYWGGFRTVMDFVGDEPCRCCCHCFDCLRKEERKKRREKRRYSERVRSLAEFVKKRDKRVINMSLTRKVEMARKKEEEIREYWENKIIMDKERLDRAAVSSRAYEEVEEEEEEGGHWEEKAEEEEEELYCAVCGKKFKSDKQWKNHEQSKKHKVKVAELRQSFVDEEEEEGNDDLELEEDADEERFREGLRIEEEEEEEENGGENIVGESGNKDDGFFDVEEGVDHQGIDSENDEEEEENSVLEAMVSRQKSRNTCLESSEDAESQTEFDVKQDESDHVEGFMEYDNPKNTRRNRRRGKKDRRRGKKINGSSEANKSDSNEDKNKNEEASASDALHVEEKQPENDKVGNGDKLPKKQPVDRKGNTKKEINTKSNNSSQGKKAKGTISGNVCETCGVGFRSKKKLHKHLGDTGHATLKFR